MVFKRIAAPFRWVDNQLLTQYTKITNAWESKGRNRYSLAGAIGGINLIGSQMVGSVDTEPPKDPENTKTLGEVLVSLPPEYILPAVGILGAGFFVHWVQVWDPFHSAINYFTRRDYTEGAVAKDHIGTFGESAFRFARMPIFALGSTMAYFTLDNVLEGNYDTLSSGAFVSASLLATASSLYIKEGDPKLLNKEPFWKKATRSVLEKLNDWLPEPAPAHNYLSLEARCKDTVRE